MLLPSVSEEATAALLAKKEATAALLAVCNRNCHLLSVIDVQLSLTYGLAASSELLLLLLLVPVTGAISAPGAGSST
jgi:hypothetical protein